MCSRGAEQCGRACSLTCPADLLARIPAMCTLGCGCPSAANRLPPREGTTTCGQGCYCPPCQPGRGWPGELASRMPSADCAPLSNVAAPPPPIDCLHAKARPRAAKDATARQATQDAADLGASLFVYCMHDIFLWSRAGLFKSFEICFSTLDFFVYNMCGSWVYTCVCVCVDIDTPSYRVYMYGYV